MVEQPYTADAIRGAISRLESGNYMPWPELSCLLDAIDNTEYWSDSSSSFSNWLKINSGRLGLKESTLWRYLIVGRYYRELRIAFPSVLKGYPALDQLPSHVSPEKLELLGKLSRVVPRDIFEPLIQSALENRISRDELRTEWHSFRPALQGRTARGRGVAPPRVNPENDEQFYSVLEAIAFNSLRSLGPKWLGTNKAFMYELKLHVMPEYSSHHMKPRKYEFDAVALLKRSKQKPIEIHGIEIGTLSSVLTEKYVEMSKHCDFFWVLVNCSEREASDRYAIPEFVGLICIEGTTLSVARNAKRCDKDCESHTALLRGLLVKETRK